MSAMQQLGTPLTTLQTESKIHSLAFSAAGDCLVSAHEGGALQVWDTQTYARIAQKRASTTERVYPKLAVNARTGECAIAQSTTLEVFALPSLTILAQMQTVAGGSTKHHTSALASLPDGGWVTGHRNGVLRLWPSRGNQPDRRVFDPKKTGAKGVADVRHVAALGDDRIVTIHDNGGCTRVWDISTRSMSHVVRGTSGWFFVVPPSLDIILTMESVNVGLHNISDGNYLDNFVLEGPPAVGMYKDSLGLAIHGNTVFALGSAHRLLSWSLDHHSSRAQTNRPSPTSSAGVLVLSNDGQMLAEIRYDTILLYRVAEVVAGNRAVSH